MIQWNTPSMDMPASAPKTAYVKDVFRDPRVDKTNNVTDRAYDYGTDVQ